MTRTPRSNLLTLLSPPPTLFLLRFLGRASFGSPNAKRLSLGPLSPNTKRLSLGPLNPNSKRLSLGPLSPLEHR